MNKIEIALNRRGLSLKVVVIKTAISVGQLPPAVYLGFYNGCEYWLAYQTRVLYKVGEE